MWEGLADVPPLHSAEGGMGSENDTYPMKLPIVIIVNTSLQLFCSATVNH